PPDEGAAAGSWRSLRTAPAAGRSPQRVPLRGQGDRPELLHRQGGGGGGGALVPGTGVEGADHDPAAVRPQGVDGPHDDPLRALLPSFAGSRARASSRVSRRDGSSAPDAGGSGNTAVDRSVLLRRRWWARYA